MDINLVACFVFGIVLAILLIGLINFLVEGIRLSTIEQAKSLLSKKSNKPNKDNKL